MRIWNGLRVKDIVIYKDKRYIVEELYEINNVKCCNLISCDGEEKVKEVDILECKKETY